MSQDAIRETDGDEVVEKSLSLSQNSVSFMNTTQDSAEDEVLKKFSPNDILLRARMTIYGSDDEIGADMDSEEIEVSPASLGIDFV